MPETPTYDPLQTMIASKNTNAPRFRPLKTISVSFSIFFHHIQCFRSIWVVALSAFILPFYLRDHVNDNILMGAAFVLIAPFVICVIIDSKDLSQQSTEPLRILRNLIASPGAWMRQGRFWKIILISIIPLFSTLIETKIDSLEKKATNVSVNVSGRSGQVTVQYAGHEIVHVSPKNGVRVFGNNGLNNFSYNNRKHHAFGFADLSSRIFRLYVLLFIVFFFQIRLIPILGAFADRRTRPFSLAWSLSRGSFWRLTVGDLVFSGIMMLGFPTLNLLFSDLPKTAYLIFVPFVTAGFGLFLQIVAAIYLGLTYRFFERTRPHIMNAYPQTTQVTTTKSTKAEAPLQKSRPKRTTLQKSKTQKPKPSKSPTSEKKKP